MKPADAGFFMRPCLSVAMLTTISRPQMAPTLRALALAALLVPAAASAGNFAECILERVPGLENNHAANAAHQVCIAKYPGGLPSVKQGVGRGFFSYDSGAECTLKKAADTRSDRAAQLISLACRRLYDEDGPWIEMQSAPSNLKPYYGPVYPLDSSPK